MQLARRLQRGGLAKTLSDVAIEAERALRGERSDKGVEQHYMRNALHLAAAVVVTATTTASVAVYVLKQTIRGRNGSPAVIFLN